MRGIKWKPPEIEIARTHAKAIIDKKSNYLRSTKFLKENDFTYRTYASILNRLQSEVWYLKRHPLDYLASYDIEKPLLKPKPEIIKDE